MVRCVRCKTSFASAADKRVHMKEFHPPQKKRPVQLPLLNTPPPPPPSPFQVVHADNDESGTQFLFFSDPTFPLHNNYLAPFTVAGQTWYYSVSQAYQVVFFFNGKIV